jgi:hypothetical protein
MRSRPCCVLGLLVTTESACDSSPGRVSPFVLLLVSLPYKDLCWALTEERRQVECTGVVLNLVHTAIDLSADTKFSILREGSSPHGAPSVPPFSISFSVRNGSN